LQEGLKDLDFNSVEFQNEMKEHRIEIDKQLKEFSGGNFAREQELQKRELENHLKEIELNTELNKKEKEQIKTKLKETVERMNSKEFQDQLKKQLEDAKESLEQHRAKFESGEFENRMKEQRENIQQQLKKIESPEFQEKINKQIKESKTRIQEHIKKVNSDEYRKELEERIKNQPTSSLNYDSPELVTRIFHQDSTTPLRTIRTSYKTPKQNGILSRSLIPLRGVRTGYRIPKQSGIMFRSISDEDSSKQPLIILDGEKITRAQMDQISPNKIASISVLKDDSAIKLYGEEAKNGVILIDTKSQNPTKKGASHSAKIDEVVVLGYGNMKNIDPITVVGYGNNWKKGHPLYVVDGKILSDQNIKQLDKNDIESINVIKDALAIEKYGEEAKHGVIEISTKPKNSKNEPIIKIKGASINNPLYIIDGKKTSAKKADKINPDDIESIDVLKGEHAIEKYGEKAKNGVVIITSKAKK
ncbi:MAG: bla regulator protein BlaR1, partial [bacterium]